MLQLATQALPNLSRLEVLILNGEQLCDWAASSSLLCVLMWSPAHRSRATRQWCWSGGYGGVGHRGIAGDDKLDEA